MHPIHILAPSLIALACFLCAPQEESPYKAPNPSTPTDVGQATLPNSEPVNPVYDTPAAYEEAGTSTAQKTIPPVNIPAAPMAPKISTPTAPRPSSNGAAIIHTVVAGDTLSGISAKYKVPIAAIKQANGMTKDTVVLGRKMAIPTSY